MNKLIVNLPANRDFEGSLRLEAEGGRVVAGPFPVCGRADRETARKYGNSTANAMLLFGDTPLGRYRVSGVQPTGKRTGLPLEYFGPNGVIVLTPVAGDAALADANGRFCIVIQGGPLGVGRRLRPTNGALRLADRDQRILIRALRRSRHSCSCEVVARDPEANSRKVALNARSEFSDPPLTASAVSPSAGFTIAGASAAGADPFLPGLGNRRRMSEPAFLLANVGGGAGGGAGGGGGAAGDSYGDSGTGGWSGDYPNLGGALDDMKNNFVNCSITGFPGKLTADANDALLGEFNRQLNAEGQPSIDAASANLLKGSLNSVLWSNFFASAGQCVATQSASAFGSVDPASSGAAVPQGIAPPQGSTTLTLGAGIFTFNSNESTGVNYTTSDFLNFAKSGSLNALLAPVEANLNKLSISVDNKGASYDLNFKLGFTATNQAGKIDFNQPNISVNYKLSF